MYGLGPNRYTQIARENRKGQMEDVRFFSQWVGLQRNVSVRTLLRTSEIQR